MTEAEQLWGLLRDVVDWELDDDLRESVQELLESTALECPTRDPKCLLTANDERAMGFRIHVVKALLNEAWERMRVDLEDVMRLKILKRRRKRRLAWYKAYNSQRAERQKETVE